MGDSVNGAAIAGGVITAGVPNVLLGGRPATVVGSAAAGPNPATGVPVATTAASPPVATVIFG